MKATLRFCKNGHSYYKSSDCPTCPHCEAAGKPDTGLLSVLYAPARRALLNAGITTEEHLATFTETEILTLHGMGHASLPKLREHLQSKGLSFRKN